MTTMTSDFIIIPTMARMKASAKHPNGKRKRMRPAMLRASFSGDKLAPTSIRMNPMIDPRGIRVTRMHLHWLSDDMIGFFTQGYALRSHV